MGTYVLHEHMFAVKVNLNEAGNRRREGLAANCEGNLLHVIADAPTSA